MKNLVLLIFGCLSFVFASAQRNNYMDGYYVLPNGQMPTLQSGGAPGIVPYGTESLQICAPYLPNIVKHEWFRSYMDVIEGANSNCVTFQLQESDFKSFWFGRIEYHATDKTGKVHEGYYYFQIK